MTTPSNKHMPFRRLFDSLDSDGDGVALREELLAAAQGSLGSALAKAFDTLDDDADGTLTWEEFAELLARMPIAPEDGLSAEGLLACIDRDGSGTISAPELLHVLASLDAELTLDDAEAIVREFDHDGNGMIDLKEFASCLDELRDHPPAPQIDAHRTSCSTWT